MNYNEVGIFQHQKIKIKSLLPEMGINEARNEIVKGLEKTPPRISSKYFYDKTGSDLFEEITRLEEYYPTRTEQSILKVIAPEIMNRFSEFEVVELGSGDCSKISILLDAVQNENIANVSYQPVDISSAAIKKSAEQLTQQFPEIKIQGFVADFIHQFKLLPPSNIPRMICLLGSTIGNFSNRDAKSIFKNLARGMQQNDVLLMGFDLQKPIEILEAAYNDKKGVTERFNKNILNAVNQIIQSNFNEKDFEHQSFFNSQKSRIEMHLVAKKNCVVESPFFRMPLEFKKDDSIHTENSYKYSLPMIEELISGAGLKTEAVYHDKNKWFTLVEFKLMPIN